MFPFYSRVPVTHLPIYPTDSALSDPFLSEQLSSCAKLQCDFSHHCLHFFRTITTSPFQCAVNCAKSYTTDHEAVAVLPATITTLLYLRTPCHKGSPDYWFHPPPLSSLTGPVQGKPTMNLSSAFLTTVATEA